MTHTRTKLAALLAIVITLTDQISKWWVLNLFSAAPEPTKPIVPFFNLVLVHNRGVTFGLLNSVNHAWVTYGLIAVACAIVFLLGRWLIMTTSTRVAIALGAIIGGALGNVIDRLYFGSVVDFLDFYYGAYHWPAFNIADSAIVCGVALLLLDSMVRAK